jgi:T5orf172 domain
MGWLYLLKAEIDASHGMALVKIGMSNKTDFHDRVSSIQDEWQRERNVKVVILAIEQCQDALSVERALHQKFAPYRQTLGHIRQALGGSCSGDSEWFLVPESMIAERGEITWSADRMSDYSNIRGDERFPWAGLILIVGVLFLILPKPTPASAPKLIIQATGHQGANVRVTPGGAIVPGQSGFIPNGSEVQIQKCSNGWCEISPKRWVYCELINQPL